MLGWERAYKVENLPVAGGPRTAGHPFSRPEGREIMHYIAKMASWLSIML
jgi:hypothetical protein